MRSNLDARLTKLEAEMHEPKRIKASDPKVVELLEYLGVDTINTSRVVITIEAGKSVKLEVTKMATIRPTT